MIKEIPVCSVELSDSAIAKATKAITDGLVSSSGPAIGKFEKEFARMIGASDAIAVSSGTAALHIALLTLGIGPGDEVIVPAFTMGATWLAVLYTGAKPVFVDCSKYDWNIDPNLISAKITKKTKAILIAHIYGRLCDMEKIMSISMLYDIPVIEDAAESLFCRKSSADLIEDYAGTTGLIGCFSFYANKLFTTGEGGMIVTHDLAIAEKARRYRDLCHSEKRFIHDGIGFNYRMTNIQASLGLGNLESIVDFIDKKSVLAFRYRNLDVPGIKKYQYDLCWMYCITVNKKEFGCSRDVLRDELADVGIQTRDFFYSPAKHPVLTKYVTESYKHAEHFAKTGLYLPSGPDLTGDEIHYICNQIARIHRKYKKKC